MLSLFKAATADYDRYLQAQAEPIPPESIGKRADYYSGDRDAVPGYWLGSGAKALGLQGQVQPEHLRAVMSGRDPGTGRPLVQLTSEGQGSRHVSGWDCTFSDDKTVSVLEAVADESLRQAIGDCRRTAIARVADAIERYAGFTRRGKHGAKTERAKLIFSAFEHFDSRDGQPQSHVHMFLHNVVVRPDGTTGTLHSPELYRHKMAFGAMYRAEVATLLSQRLGLTISPGPEGTFRVEGVSTAVVGHFSSRRREIVAKMKEKGLSSARAAELVALETRKVKVTADLSTLREGWRREAQAFGFGAREAANLVRGPRVLKNGTTAATRHGLRAARQLVRVNGHFARHDILRALATEGQYRGWDIRTVERAANATLSHGKLIAVGQRFTTRQHLKLEQKLTEATDRLATRKEPWASQRVRSATLAKYPTLTREQVNAFQYITGGGGDVKTVRGLAGTGKTFVLGAVREALQREGVSVLGATLSAKAARELQKGAGVQSDTIEMTLRRLRPTATDRAKHVVRQLTRAALKKPTYSLTRLSLRRTVLVIDEVSMATTTQLCTLIRAAQKAGAKVLLVGDDRQLQSIEAGGAFSALHRRLGGTELLKITRQRDPWMRRAVEQIAEGDVRAALSEYASHGRLKLTDTQIEARERLVRRWVKQRTANPADTLILAATNQDVAAINTLAQSARRRKGELGRYRRQRLPDGWVYERDRVLITGNSRALDVRNGDLGTVERIGLDTLTVRLDDCGRRVKLTKADYPALRLGYCLSTHRAQGATVDKAFVLLGGSMQDRELSYVQLSRARSETHLFCTRAFAGPELAEMAHAMAVSRRKTLAVEQTESAVHLSEPRQQRRPEDQHRQQPRAQGPTVQQL